MSLKQSFWTKSLERKFNRSEVKGILNYFQRFIHLKLIRPYLSKFFFWTPTAKFSHCPPTCAKKSMKTGRNTNKNQWISMKIIPFLHLHEQDITWLHILNGHFSSDVFSGGDFWFQEILWFFRLLSCLSSILCKSYGFSNMVARIFW